MREDVSISNAGQTPEGLAERVSRLEPRARPPVSQPGSRPVGVVEAQPGGAVVLRAYDVVCSARSRTGGRLPLSGTASDRDHGGVAGA
jgi:hypothetical protein